MPKKTVNLYKTKKQLDKLSYEKVMEVRYNVLRKGMTFDQQDKRYVTELELYEKIRFKDKELERFKRWKDQVKNGDPKDATVKATKMLVDIGFKTLQAINIAHALLELGECKYILGIDVPKIPKKLMTNFNKIEKLP